MVSLCDYGTALFFIYILVFLHFKTIYICHTKPEHPVCYKQRIVTWLTWAAAAAATAADEWAADEAENDGSMYGVEDEAAAAAAAAWAGYDMADRPMGL